MCRHYLPHGRRRGRYWVTGDIDDTPGRSLYVRLCGPDSGPGAAGKWSDAATGEHGDLLDLIGRRRHLPRVADAIGEARAFLALPRPSSADALPRRSSRAVRFSGSGPPPVCRSDVRSPAPRPKPICAPAGSPPGSTGRPCAFTPRSGTARAKRIRAKPGRRCWPRSPTTTAPSPASSAAGSTAPARQRRRSPIRAAPSAISSATASASAARQSLPPRRRGSWRPAKASKRCWRSLRCCRPCR